MFALIFNEKMTSRNISFFSDKPELVVKFGTGLFSKIISEYHDVYFKCEVKANPTVRKVTWYFQGEKVRTSDNDNVILRELELVLQKVSRKQKGMYTCQATNSQGTGSSPDFQLRITCKSHMYLIWDN